MKNERGAVQFDGNNALIWILAVVGIVLLVLLIAGAL